MQTRSEDTEISLNTLTQEQPVVVSEENNSAKKKSTFRIRNRIKAFSGKFKTKKPTVSKEQSITPAEENQKTPMENMQPTIQTTPQSTENLEIQPASVEKKEEKEEATKKDLKKKKSEKSIKKESPKSIEQLEEKTPVPTAVLEPKMAEQKKSKFFKKKSQEIEKNKEELEALRSKLEAQTQQKENELAALQVELDAQKQKNAEKEKAVLELKKDLDAVNKEIEEKNQINEGRKKEIDRMTQEIANMRKETLNAREEIQAKEAEIKKLNKPQEKTNQKDLKKLIDNFFATVPKDAVNRDAFNNALNSLLRQISHDKDRALHLEKLNGLTDENKALAIEAAKKKISTVNIYYATMDMLEKLTKENASFAKKIEGVVDATKLKSLQDEHLKEQKQILTDYENECKKTTLSSKIWRSLALVLCTAVGFVVGAAIGLIVGALTTGPGAPIVATAFGFTGAVGGPLALTGGLTSLAGSGSLLFFKKWGMHQTAGLAAKAGNKLVEAEAKTARTTPAPK